MYVLCRIFIPMELCCSKSTEKFPSPFPVIPYSEYTSCTFMQRDDEKAAIGITILCLIIPGSEIIQLAGGDT